MKQFFLILLALLIIPAILSYAYAAKDDSGKVNNCIDCHSKLQGNLKKPVAAWKKSVHGKKGGSCNLCHGGDPAAADKRKAKSLKFIGKPDKKQIIDFCGRGGCHALPLKQFKRGPHYQSVLKTNSPNCTHCHGVHTIQTPSAKIINEKACTSCHTRDYSRQILKTINTIDTKISLVDKNIHYLSEKSVDVKTLSAKLNKTRHLFRQLVHVFSKSEMESTKEIIQVRIDDLINTSKSKVAISKRLDLLYIMMLSFGILIVGGFSLYTIFMFTRRKH